MDDYIRFDGYGNLETLSDYDRDRELTAGSDEIIERFIELADENHVDVEYLLKEYA